MEVLHHNIMVMSHDTSPEFQNLLENGFKYEGVCHRQQRKKIFQSGLRFWLPLTHLVLTSPNKWSTLLYSQPQRIFSWEVLLLTSGNVTTQTVMQKASNKMWIDRELYRMDQVIFHSELLYTGNFSNTAWVLSSNYTENVEKTQVFWSALTLVVSYDVALMTVAQVQFTRQTCLEVVLT